MPNERRRDMLGVADKVDLLVFKKLDNGLLGVEISREEGVDDLGVE